MTDNNHTGAQSHPYYKRWADHKNKCTNPNNKQYANYGGRGIKMWEGWVDDPLSYCLYLDTLPREEGCDTIDRVNNDEGYYPMNLRWATRKQQNNNQRSPVFHDCDWLTRERNYKGTGQYRVRGRFYYNGKTFCTKRYKTDEEARQAVLELREEIITR